MSVINYLLITMLYFVMWMLYSYWMHRLAHIPHKYNFLFKIHMAHHKDEHGKKPSLPKWKEFFLWYGGLKQSLDDFITLSLPVIVIAIIDPNHGIPLLIIHYFYEIFLGSDVLDHNPKVRGNITKFFAFGQFHLTHHRHARKNYSHYITLWDYVFKTASLREINKVESYLETKRSLKGE